MIQIIGLIVAVYTVARLVQVPFELQRDENTAWGFVRLIVVGVVSVVGVLAVGLLTVALLDAPKLPADLGGIERTQKR